MIYSVVSNVVPINIGNANDVMGGPHSSAPCFCLSGGHSGCRAGDLADFNAAMETSARIIASRSAICERENVDLRGRTRPHVRTPGANYRPFCGNRRTPFKADLFIGNAGQCSDARLVARRSHAQHGPPRCRAQCAAGDPAFAQRPAQRKPASSSRRLRARLQRRDGGVHDLQRSGPRLGQARDGRRIASKASTYGTVLASLRRHRRRDHPRKCPNSAV